MDEIIKVENVVKQYRLGQINHGTLKADLQSWWAKIRGKEDPNMRIDAKRARGAFRALDDVSLTVKKGERLGIIGHNGAGKSTLLKLLSRVTGPTEGRIYINGRFTSMLEVGTGFHPELTGRENIFLNGAILGMSHAEVAAKFDKIVEFAEIKEFIDTPVKRYSSGMFVKLAFSVAANLDSDIVVMDEVLAVGDMKFQQKCIDKMNQISREEGRTILYVSHNMATIRQLCTRCIVLNRGRVQYDGDVEKAISFYMNQESGIAKYHYDLDSVGRATYGLGVGIKITAFEFLDNPSCVFDYDRPVRFKVWYHVGVSTEQVRIRLEFHAADSTSFAMAESDVIGDVEEGKSYCTEFSLDVSNIAEGTYYVHLDVYRVNSNGVHITYDHPEQNIYMIISSNSPEKIAWNTRDWGHVHLNNMKPLNTEMTD